MTETRKPSCPRCGEEVKESWKFCPACETPLTPPSCPHCGIPVKAHWRRCPECGNPLICKTCGTRLSAGQAECPACGRREAADEPLSQTFREPITGMVFLPVPAGSFLMGDTFGDGFENELPVHEVTLDSYYIARYPVTQSQWTTLMGDNPSKFKGELHPVEQVTWHEARAFVRKLTEAHKGEWVFDLPTEAQWEYAARSGGRQEFYAGGDDVESLAWYDENSGGTTRPVGLKAPNGLGIHDMSGNVWEWCLDGYEADAYKRHASRNPVHLKEDLDRILRGGSWNIDAWSVRCARRFSLRADLSGAGVGFRPVMLPVRGERKR
ncbi:MAG: SUMF1/EgtB/PvdO family nonheme iron enzyme [Deltaproteobacteria bacterium]|nr:SUMF1/EgtB/PvdO family nonheme iron enzyme [Deltaproteobacteria bacterium]MBW2017020.1 SUMF1/EgtB/PvdO family nonheme iron enzyme [Deltaproteobacteria bacterium]MBW2302177.1 SUMF1/EgtB/PvdO family nonheme iron enzyme [Deltaproteobacteria bacterium]